MHDKLNYIGDYAFYKCDGLSTIEFSDNVTNIGEYCFCDCRLLENIKLPRFLETLKIGALQNTNICEITIPGSVTEIGSGCFLNCNHLKTVEFEDSDLDLTLGYGQYNRQPLFIGNPIQRLYLGRNLKEKTMTSNIGYSISPFMDQTELTNVTIGNNVKIIGPCLFSGCSSLSEINTPNSLEQIGNGAFEGCTNLPIFDNIQYAGKCAVRVVDKNLDSYNIANDTKFILSACFSGCVNLKKIDLPNSIIYWGDYVFEGCTKLKEITIPDKVETIAKKMFSGCEELENISIPSNIKIINSDAFTECDSLEQIIFPATLNLLGQECCSYMPGLKRIYCMASEPPVCEESTLNPGNSPFGKYNSDFYLSTPNDIPVYVPVGTAEKYRNAWGWDYFTNFIETDDFPTSIHNVTTEHYDSKNCVYDLMGRKVINPQKGQVYIKNGKKKLFAY